MSKEVEDRIVDNSVKDSEAGAKTEPKADVKPKPKAKSKAKAEENEKLREAEEKELKSYISDTCITDLELAKRLKDLGIERSYIKSFRNAYASFDDKTLKTLAKEEEDRVIEHESAMLNDYIRGTIITDMSFAYRLKRLNMPKLFVQIYRDEDRSLSDKKIWEKAREVDAKNLVKY